MAYEDDDDEKEGMKDSILQHLLGEVDGYAAEQLPGEEEEKPTSIPSGKGVEIAITVTPHGQETPEGVEGGKEEGEDEEHDEIAHALGMHSGGCTY